MQPPKKMVAFLRWFCRPDYVEEIEGDLNEMFRKDLAHSPSRARWKFALRTVRYFRPEFIKSFNIYPSNSTGMFRNHFKIGVRNLAHHKAFTLINVLGLTIGLACFMLISAFVLDELNYDRYPSNYKNIYRVSLRLVQNGGVDDYPSVDVAVGEGIKNAFPEVLETTRLAPLNGFDYIQHEDVNVRQESIVYADSNFLSVFSIPLVEGNIHKALAEPNSIVISQAMAKKYFGEKPAMGAMMNFRRAGLLRVTGIFDKIPDRSHFHYEAFISMTTGQFHKMRQTWSNVGFYSYIVVNEHADVSQLEAKLPQLVDKYVVPEVAQDMAMSREDAEKSVSNWKFYLRPISEIHLYSHTRYELEANGDITNVYLFGTLALFILVLACVNFMNLSTANAGSRGIEIGIRKALGSMKAQLMSQFLVESIILSLVALVFAIGTALMLLPLFNQLTGKQFETSLFFSPEGILSMLAVGVIVGILSGAYPAFFLSSFQPLRILKGSTAGTSGKAGLRKALVVFQFSISTALIVATLVAYQQLNYMQQIKIGYDKEQILVIDNAGALRKDEIAFKHMLKNDHRVINATNSDVPLGLSSSFGGSEVFAKERNTTNIHIFIFTADYDYLETMGMEMALGRNFSREFLSDSLGENVIINETAMRDLGWNESNVLGGTIVRSATRQHKVVGVIKDFHYTSTREQIAPLMIAYRGYSPSMLVKVNTADLPGLITDVEKQWKSFHVDLPFSYYFLNDRFENLYQSEQTIKKIFTVFMVVAVLIAGLGLYGLSIHAAAQRVKEIGIRKVLGSTVQQIVILQSREFITLVMIAIVIASPVAWWVMSRWLENFGYHIEISLWTILLSGAAAIIIAMVTVSFQAVKAATANPSQSLKAEG